MWHKVTSLVHTHNKRYLKVELVELDLITLESSYLPSLAQYGTRSEVWSIQWELNLLTMNDIIK